MPYVYPAGITPAGFPTTPAGVATGLAPALLADTIDPITRDIASLFVGTHPVDAAAIFLLTTRRRSGVAVQNVGHGLDAITKATDDAPQRIKDDILLAWAPLLKGGHIRLLKLQATIIDDMAAVLASYLNLRRRIIGAANDPRILRVT